MSAQSARRAPTSPPDTTPDGAVAAAAASDTTWPDSGLLDRALEYTLGRPRNPSRWVGWRLRALLLLAFAGVAVAALYVHWLASIPRLPGDWRVAGGQAITLEQTQDPLLAPVVGHRLIAIESARGTSVRADALLLHGSPRWLYTDALRARYRKVHSALATAIAEGPVRLVFDSGQTITLEPRPSAFLALPPSVWLLLALALALYVSTLAATLARPSLRTTLYALIALAQAVNLAIIAMEVSFPLGVPTWFAGVTPSLRMALDLLTASAVVHAALIHPTRLPGAAAIATLCWAAMVALGWAIVSGALPNAWGWTQTAVAAAGSLVIGLFAWSYRQRPHPTALLLGRLSAVSVATWALLSVSIAAAGELPGTPHAMATVGAVVWYVFFAALLLTLPFLSPTQQLMREFALLAATATLVTSLDLLLVGVFSLGQFSSLTVAILVSFAAYAAARQWIINRMVGARLITTERLFEQLYRVVREVEQHPERTAQLLAGLLRLLYDPLETLMSRRSTTVVRMSGDAATLIVPVPNLVASALPTEDAPRSVLIRFAQRGQRLFNRDDVRLTERILEQLHRAVDYDEAVAQGRSEERVRLAQDLHDDIGARLLTLMYKAPDAETEEYVRHTLQDLKTLTRGLAARQHWISDAAAEWKADIAQRLALVQCTLDWHASLDRDVLLSVVQWSALTRVMRELVSNVIAHSRATRVDIGITLEHDRLDIVVSDDGIGTNPAAWAHGLGLGGVRKRVRQLGGNVEWRDNPRRGITCHVRVRQLSKPQ